MAISIGATILNAVLGRKTVSVGSLGRATTAARGAGRVLKEREDAARAGETVAAVQQALAGLEAELQAEVTTLEAKGESERLESVAIRPKKTDVRVRLCALAWMPHWRDPAGTLTPAWTWAPLRPRNPCPERRRRRRRERSSRVCEAGSRWPFSPSSHRWGSS